MVGRSMVSGLSKPNNKDYTNTFTSTHHTRKMAIGLPRKHVCLNTYFDAIYNSCIVVSLINLHLMQFSCSRLLLETQTYLLYVIYSLAIFILFQLKILKKRKKGTKTMNEKMKRKGKKESIMTLNPQRVKPL